MHNPFKSVLTMEELDSFPPGRPARTAPAIHDELSRLSKTWHDAQGHSPNVVFEADEFVTAEKLTLQGTRDIADKLLGAGALYCEVAEFVTLIFELRTILYVSSVAESNWLKLVMPE